jgi:hypothetical protein
MSLHVQPIGHDDEGSDPAPDMDSPETVAIAATARAMAKHIRAKCISTRLSVPNGVVFG